MSDTEENAENNQPPALPPSSGGSAGDLYSRNFPLPPKLVVTGDLAKNWKNFRQLWDSYEIATGLSERQDKYRIATLITCIGAEALSLYNGLPFANPDDRQNMSTTLKLLDEHCVGQTNVIYERYLFNNRDQEPGESIENYVATLRRMAQSCEFDTLADQLIRDRIVCGISDTVVRKRLLQERGLNLNKCIDMCRSAETAQSRVKTMSAATEVHRVERTRAKPRQSPHNHQAECKFCGRKHELVKEHCPAFGKLCNNCGKNNHFASKCNAKAGKNPSPKTSNSNRRRSKGAKSVHAISEDYDEEILSVEWEKRETVNAVSEAKYATKIFATMTVAGKPVKFQVDSGASCNVLPRSSLPRTAEIKESHATLTMYSKTSMPVVGTSKVRFVNPKNNKSYRAEFVIVDGEFTPLLGARASQQLKLITVMKENISVVEESHDTVNTVSGSLNMQQIFTEYGDVFEGHGLMQGKRHLEVDTSVQPQIMPPRRIPIAMKAKVKDELD